MNLFKFVLAMLIISVSCIRPARRNGYPPEDTILIVQLRDEIVADITENLLPFWKDNSVDPDGSFYGAIAYNGKGIVDANKHNVLFSRYLWTYSAAYRVFGDKEYLELAHRAYDHFINYFWDREKGGVFWCLSYDNTVLDSNKMTYGMAYALYGLSEYYRITGNEESLETSIKLFHLIEEKAKDPVYGGYLEAFTADWNFLPGEGMAEGYPKSMNTHLHLLEAYTNLYRVWPDKLLRAKLYEIIDVFFNHIINTENFHLDLYFEKDWTVYGNPVSYGHDIEFSWLFDEAGKILGDQEIIAKIHDVAIKIAEIQLEEGLNADGAMIYEKTDESTYHDFISWWVQTEAILGFINAYEISLERKYLDASLVIWEYIKEHMIDREYGGWYPHLFPDGTPYPDEHKGNYWTCPYHNGRLGFEIYERFHDHDLNDSYH